MKSAVFLGLATLDLIYEVDGLPGENDKSVARRQEILCGGPAANAAITGAFLGAPATFVGAIGRHSLTRAIRDEFARFGVTAHDLAPGSNEVPSLSSIFVNARTGTRTIVSGHATREQVPGSAFQPAILNGAGLLMVDGNQIACATVACVEARKNGIPVVLDGGSWKVGTEKLLAQTDVAICSEAFRAPGTETLADVIDYLLAAGVRHAAITRGGSSVLWGSGSDRGEIAVPSIEAVDTLGAGDIFHGAYCRCTLAGAAFVDALSFAAEVASRSCEFFGTRAWMETWRHY